MKNSQSSGFTFIELLIVISIIGLIFSIVVPFSQARYEKYKGTIEAEKVLLFLSEMRRKAFLYGKEIEIDSKEGALVTSEGNTFKVEGGFIEIKKPFKFYPSGTTNGGKVYFHYGKSSWIIEINPPFSELTLKEKESEKE